MKTFKIMFPEIATVVISFSGLIYGVIAESYVVGCLSAAVFVGVIVAMAYGE